VFGVRQVDDERLAGPEIAACNLEDRAGLARLFDRHEFAAVLDCDGNCALKACELNPAMARRINVEGPRNLVAESARGRARLVHLSVDLVFAGREEAGYTEDEPPDPVTVYGKTMAAGEQAVLDTDPSACVVRISLPMGLSLNGHAGAIDWIRSRFVKSREATLYYDEVRTPTYVDCMNRLYEMLLACSASGIFHAPAARRLSLYQIGQVINRVGGYDPRLLFGLARGHAGPIPPRAGNVSMDGGKLARELGCNPLAPWPLDDALVPTHRDWHHERPSGEVRSVQRLIEVLATGPADGKDAVIAAKLGGRGKSGA
jgi:dTDP-4-dehydrorhamnose reductase